MRVVALLADEQVAGRGRAGGERGADVTVGIGEGLEGEAVADREQVGDDRLGVVAEAEHALALLRLEHLGDVGAGAVEELADLVLDFGVAPAGAEQLVEEQEEGGFVLDQVGEAGDEDVEDVVDRLRLASGSSRRATRISASRRTTSTSSRSLVPK